VSSGLVRWSLSTAMKELGARIASRMERRCAMVAVLFMQVSDDLTYAHRIWESAINADVDDI